MIVDYDKLREFIGRCKWHWAKTMMDVPHEYINRYHCELADSEFHYFFCAQRENGVHERWGKNNFPYLYVDGYKYWTMGDPWETTFILNRQKVFGEFDFLEWPIPRTYELANADVMQRTILKTFSDKPIFECGFGNGDFVRLSKIQPDRYYGVDPSKKAVRLFRENMSGFYHRCSTISFEEAVNKWLSAGSVIIALFGAASYFMEQYLKKLSESGLDYCLMFYREDYCPEEFAEMHCFCYTKNDIRRIFPKSNIYNHKNYSSVSSRPLVWQKSEIQMELFQ